MKVFPAASNVWRYIFVTLSFIFLMRLESLATHLRAGDIVITPRDCGGREYEITITVYTNSNSTVLFGGDQDIIDYGDGTWDYVPQQDNVLRLDLDPDGTVSTATWKVTHTYGSPGTYIVSYREPNRNEGILNMDNSVLTTFYLETVLKIDPFLGCNDTPRLGVPPIDHACPGAAWTHNPGAFDRDKDSISYALVVPFKDRRTAVLNYRDPNHPGFYTNYNTANEEGTGRPTFSIDNYGTITWDAPGAIGEYNIAFHVIEWRKKNGKWYFMGYVRRDMQILVDDCENKRPDLILPLDTCVVAGTVLNATILGIDPDNDKVKIEAYSEIFNFPRNQSSATYSPVPGPTDYRTQPAETKFQWKTECGHVKEQPYQVVFKVTDDPPKGKGARLVTFKTWLIRVVGPPPEWESAQLNTVTNNVSLEWDAYTCANAERMQVWRKVDGAEFEPDNCETGMPDYLGYELVTELQLKDNNQAPVTAYTDTNGGKGLAPGAKYCYRLVAVFPTQGGGESYVSKDTCVGPVLADVPIMTHVSVETTDVAAGQIRVSWIPPFDIDTTGFRYELYRSVGFTRGNDSVLVVGNLRNSDTTFLDTGLNTEDNVYNYSVTSYSAAGELLGSSFPASSVRLSAQSQVGRISLTWNAVVPWSNQIQTFPSKHHIYRGTEDATESEFVLIDSVDVLATGFSFVDQGQHGELNKDETYCYRIMTRGGYGNPAIDEPLENFSQIICAQLGDTIPPCKPTLLVQSLNCEQFLEDKDNCGSNEFQNTIYWSRDRDDECDSNILGYKIYRALSADGDFIWLQDAGIVADTFFIDDNVNSFAYCYKLSAVDRSLNESELSDAVCNDNCPYYELPNVFTPNNDNCNDLFSAYSDRITSGEEGGNRCAISDEALTRCARFVESVVVKIYNRWGQEVYTYEGSIDDDVNSIYVDWDGRDNSGNQLSTGVYYYVADVTFDIVAPDKTKIIKGWVHLIR